MLLSNRTRRAETCVTGKLEDAYDYLMGLFWTKCTMIAEVAKATMSVFVSLLYFCKIVV